MKLIVCCFRLLYCFAQRPPQEGRSHPIPRQQADKTAGRQPCREWRYSNGEYKRQWAGMWLFKCWIKVTQSPLGGHCFWTSGKTLIPVCFVVYLSKTLKSVRLERHFWNINVRATYDLLRDQYIYIYINVRHTTASILFKPSDPVGHYASIQVSALPKWFSLRSVCLNIR